MFLQLNWRLYLCLRPLELRPPKRGVTPVPLSQGHLAQKPLLHGGRGVFLLYLMRLGGASLFDCQLCRAAGGSEPGFRDAMPAGRHQRTARPPLPLILLLQAPCSENPVTSQLRIFQAYFPHMSGVCVCIAPFKRCGPSGRAAGRRQRAVAPFLALAGGGPARGSQLLPAWSHTAEHLGELARITPTKCRSLYSKPDCLLST